MKKIIKVLSSIGIATAVGISTYVYKDNTHQHIIKKELEKNESINKNMSLNFGNSNQIDDIKPITVNVPTVKIPVIEIPKVDLPYVNEVILISESDIKKIGINNDDYFVNILDVKTYNPVEKINKILINYPNVSKNDILKNVIIIPNVNTPNFNNYLIDILALNNPEINQIIVNNPKINSNELLKQIINIPEIENIDNYLILSLISKIPEVNEIIVNNPKINSNELLKQIVNIPEIETYLISSLNDNLPEIKQIIINNPKIISNELLKQIVNIPEIKKVDDRIPLIQNFVKEIKKMFKDQRAIQYDNSITYDNENFKKWIEIYKKFNKSKVEFKYVNLDENIKMVAELHYPIDFDTLNKNLDFYIKNGYNSVLITFGYEKENFNEILNIAEYIKSLNLKIWFAYSGEETLHKTAYINPNELKDKLIKLSRISDGFIIGWRRTSVHLLEQDMPFTQFLIDSVRNGNPNIQILGEAYYGQTASSNENTHHISYNVPMNSSGVLINGLGYNNIVVRYALNNVFIKIKNRDRIGVILGDKPYYNTRFDNKKSFIENFKIKERLSEEWLNEGCMGTIVIHGDGSDGIYDKNFTDNIGKTPITK